MRLMLPIAAALLTLAVPAFAQDGGPLAKAFPDKEFGDWTAYGYDHDCWLKREFGDEGAEFSFSIGSDMQLYFQLDASEWSLESGKNYPLTVEFGGTSLLLDGQALATQVTAITDGPGDQHLDALERAKTLKATVDRYSADIALPTDPGAYSYFRQCLAMVKKLP